LLSGSLKKGRFSDCAIYEYIHFAKEAKVPVAALIYGSDRDGFKRKADGLITIER
jgi:hypothetical protein